MALFCQKVMKIASKVGQKWNHVLQRYGGGLKKSLAQVSKNIVSSAATHFFRACWLKYANCLWWPLLESSLFQGRKAAAARQLDAAVAKMLQFLNFQTWIFALIWRGENHKNTHRRHATKMLCKRPPSSHITMQNFFLHKVKKTNSNSFSQS